MTNNKEEEEEEEGEEEGQEGGGRRRRRREEEGMKGTFRITNESICNAKFPLHTSTICLHCIIRFSLLFNQLNSRE
jgi:hypothetical protein